MLKNIILCLFVIQFGLKSSDQKDNLNLLRKKVALTRLNTLLYGFEISLDKNKKYPNSLLIKFEDKNSLTIYLPAALATTKEEIGYIEKFYEAIFIYPTKSLRDDLIKEFINAARVSGIIITNDKAYAELFDSQERVRQKYLPEDFLRMPPRILKKYYSELTEDNINKIIEERFFFINVKEYFDRVLDGNVFYNPVINKIINKKPLNNESSLIDKSLNKFNFYLEKLSLEQLLKMFNSIKEKLIEYSTFLYKYNDDAQPRESIFVKKSFLYRRLLRNYMLMMLREIVLLNIDESNIKNYEKDLKESKIVYGFNYELPFEKKTKTSVPFREVYIGEIDFSSSFKIKSQILFKNIIYNSAIFYKTVNIDYIIDSKDLFFISLNDLLKNYFKEFRECLFWSSPKLINQIMLGLPFDSYDDYTPNFFKDIKYIYKNLNSGHVEQYNLPEIISNQNYLSYIHYYEILDKLLI